MAKLAFIFPGQSSQAAGMGKDLHDAVPEARAVFEQVDAALGERLSALCFLGPEEKLKLTANTQPAILAVSAAAAAVLARAGVAPRPAPSPAPSRPLSKRCTMHGRAGLPHSQTAGPVSPALSRP